MRDFFYTSPIGQIYLRATDDALVCSEFVENVPMSCEREQSEVIHPILKEAIHWLDRYFSVGNEELFPYLAFPNSNFQKRVLQEILMIPYGETRSYAFVGEKICCCSARAVGGALGKNPLLIFFPCHRIISSSGQLTGYAGGIERKRWLLHHEQSRKERK